MCKEAKEITKGKFDLLLKNGIEYLDLKMKLTPEELILLTHKELIKMAGEFEIIGRHQMKKDLLVRLILENVQEKIKEFKKEIKIRNKNPKEHYINNLAIGQLIAFRIPKNKMIAGKIIEVLNDCVRVETKNGVKWNVQKDEIAWVKTGQRWPKGVYQAFKGYEGSEINGRIKESC